MEKRSELLRGTLDMLILKTLARAPLHGYGIALSIKRLSEDVLTVEEGSQLDPVTYLGVIALLGGVSVVACWTPAWRAARVDPAVTLRAE